MTVRWETIQVDGKPMRVYMGMPEGPGPHPAVLVAFHKFGIDTIIQDAVHRLFRAGYVAVAPDLYHRQAADVDVDQRPSLLRDTEIVDDLNATIAYLKTQPAAVQPVGVIGFCLGGRISYLAAAAVKEIKAAAIFYGSSIMVARGNSPTPFERSADIHCPIIAFTGADDKNPSPEDMKKIDAELTRLGKPHEFHLYQGADHGFHNFTGPRYRDRVARASWSEMLAFFNVHLRGGPI